MSPIPPLPHIAWQSPSRDIKVTPLSTNEVKGDVMASAAAWRFSIMSQVPSRGKTMAQMKQVIDHEIISNAPVLSQDVVDAGTLKQFYKSHFSSPLPVVDDSHCPAFGVLGDKRTRRSFTSNVKKLHEDVWSSPLLYQVGDIPLSQLIIVSVNHVPKDHFVDLDGVVGRAMFQLLEREVLERECEGIDDGQSIAKVPSPDHIVPRKNPLSAVGKMELNGLLNHGPLLSRKEGNEAVSNILKKNKEQVQTMNERSMIRWILEDRICTENLFAPGTFDPLFQLFGLILKEYGQAQVMDENSHKLVHFKATLLATLTKNEQKFHQDYSLPELLRDPKPWSADIPLVKGGLYLNIWHGWNEEAGTEFVGNHNFVLHVPLGYALLWRGDLIHGGGFDNHLNNGAMRLHLYIPMKQRDVRSLGGSTSQVYRKSSILNKLVLYTKFSPSTIGLSEEAQAPHGSFESSLGLSSSQ